MADTWAVTEASMSPESSNPWSTLLGGVAGLANEVVNIRAAGWLNDERSNSGLPSYTEQSTLQDSTGRNITGTDLEASNAKRTKLMMIGGGILALAVIVAVVK